MSQYHRERINQGLAKTFSLYFTLDNPLPANQYARIVWPYSLGFTTTWTIAGKWGAVSARCSDPDITNPIEIKLSELTADSAKFVYYIRFTSGTAGTFGNLIANQPYLLYLQALNAPGVSGTLSPIEFYTVSSGGSSTDTDYIIYDSNPNFHYLYITPTAPSSLTATYSSTSTSKNDIAASNYPIIIDITLSVAISSSSRIVLETSSTEFSFVSGTCVNLASTSPAITALTNPISVTYTSSKVLILVSEALAAGRKLRFQCGIQNPGYVTTGGLSFKTMWSNSTQVVEMTSVISGLSTTSWTWGTTAAPTANLYVYLGWGIDFTTTTNLPDCFKIYKNYDTTHYVYNSIKFGFTPSHSTPTGQEIILTLNLLTGTKEIFFFILLLLLY